MATSLMKSLWLLLIAAGIVILLLYGTGYGRVTELRVANQTIADLQRDKVPQEPELRVANQTIADLQRDKVQQEQELRVCNQTIAGLQRDKVQQEQKLTAFNQTIADLKRDEVQQEQKLRVANQMIADLQRDKVQPEHELVVYNKSRKYNGFKILYADLGKDSSQNVNKLYESCQKFHLITSFFSVRAEGHYQSFNEVQLKGRTNEYLEVLQSNLNHPCVKKVHLFYINKEDPELLYKTNFKNKHKLQLWKRSHLIHMADFFIHASRYLLGKPVIGLNADIVLGEGFHLINVKRMLEQRVMYSLTRYQGSLNCTQTLNMCPHYYQGSHDTHIFALAEPLNEALLMQKLNYATNINQAENGMIHVMKRVFEFRVFNPCITLMTYHHHCSSVRGHVGNYSLLHKGWTKEQISDGVVQPTRL